MIVTGATSGIGRAAAERLARGGATVVLACRDAQKGDAAAVAIRAATGNSAVRAMTCDVSSKESIDAFAVEFQRRFDHLDVLVNNAGIMNPRRKLTPSGIEETFATNYLGAFILTHALLGALRASRQGRVINVSSAGHRDLSRIPFDDLQLVQNYSGVRAYNLSKAALIMFTYTLAEKLADARITVNALHPGIVRSNIWPGELLYLRIGSALCKLIAVSSDKGADNTVYLATSPEVAGVTGKYFHGLREKRSSRITYDRAGQQRLWDLSLELAAIPAAL